MASGTITVKPTLAKHLVAELENTGALITWSPVALNNPVLLTFSRYGRTAGIVTTFTDIVGASNGAQFNFGTDGTLTLTGNGSTGFTITASLSGLTNVYVTIIEVVS